MPQRLRPVLLCIVLAGSIGPGATAAPPTTPSWIGEMNLVDLGFAHDVAPAGDVNGDGYSDALVTAPLFLGRGAAFVFHGSANGLTSDFQWLMQGVNPLDQFGISGSSAGDVNGDGFDDVIVGAWGYEDGEDLEGAAFVYHGGPSGLSPVANWMVESNVAEAQLGESVACAGDVNGDGYDDVIVGALHYTNGETREGRAYVYLGSFGGLSPTPVWTFESNETQALAGTAVHGAGDVNGDGYDDIIVGGSRHGVGGGVWVFHGSPTGPSASADWYRTTSQSNADFGYAVGPAGDVNGDGYADVIIGARLYDNGDVDEGAAFVYLGSAGGLSTTHAWFIDSNYPFAYYGHAVRTAGDVNGDGYAEILVGARQLPSGGAAAGRAHMYYGGPEGPDTVPRWLYGGGEPNAYLGHAISGVGDVNGDGLSDIIVGAPGKSNGEDGEGLALVFHGGPDGPVTYPPRWTRDGGAAGTRLGDDLGYAGDVNGDGLGDFLVSAPLHTGVAQFSGRAYLYHGSATGEPILAATMNGEQSTEIFGYRSRGAGDVNGDGYSDVVIGAPLWDGNTADVGRALVYHGSPTGISATPDWELAGSMGGMGYGASVAGPGDVNGDGFDDVLVGATLWSNGEEREGITYLYYGSAAGLVTTPSWSYEPDFVDAGSGIVHGAGDVNGDGYADFVIGAYGYSDSHDLEGGVFLFLGSATGPESTPDRIFTSNQGAGQMDVGTSAGDVNGDGYDDLVIACRAFHGTAGVLSGRIWIYHGSSTGPSQVADTIIEGQGQNEQLGHDVRGAGDVNGDGYSDIIAGGIYYDGGFDDQGVARIYLGSASGVVATESWEIVTEQDESALGEKVTTAGDINGDGFADVLTSAPEYDAAGGADEGRVFLHLGGCYYNPTGGASLRPRQTQHDGAPLPLGGRTIDGYRVRLNVDARSPMGRGRAALEWQMAPDGTDVTAADVVIEPWVDTGAPGGLGSVAPIAVDVSALTPDTAYQWRLRLHYDSVFVPNSRWMSLAPAVPSMVHFVTGENTVSVADPAVAVPLPRLALRPNPMRSATTIRFTTNVPGAARVSIVDVGGREVALVEESVKVAGVHAVRWDGAIGGRPAPAGVYFVRVETREGVSVGKLVVCR